MEIRALRAQLFWCFRFVLRTHTHVGLTLRYVTVIIQVRGGAVW